jgi:hypothetical protein
MTQLNFDASQVDPSVPFEVLPSDKYIVAITKSEMKPTKSGDGAYLELEYTVLEGQYQGRKLWDRLCLNHSREETVKIARANLSAICHAVGVLIPHDSNELHNIPFQITIRVKRKDDQITNEVRGYAKRESRIPVTHALSAAAPVQSVQYPQAPVNDSVPPWER